MKHHDIAKQNLYEEIYTEPKESVWEDIVTFILIAAAAIVWSAVFTSL